MDSIIASIDAYWKAANFLTVSTMYLKDNMYIKKRLQNDDLKEFVSGHWGTSPGINFIYAHLNRYISEYRRKMQLVIGPGHAGCALLSNLKLERCTHNVRFHLTSESGQYSFEEQIREVRTEINPFYPGAIYDGGELGYSLSVSYGAIMDDPDLITVCIIGDGESETGTLSASWVCNNLVGVESGKVLPIIHLNSYKMGGRSLLSYKSDSEISSIFIGMGYDPIIIGNTHEEMYKALNLVEANHFSSQNDRAPLIIFRSPKGWTAPACNDVMIEGELISHKNPIAGIRDIKNKKEYIQLWLESYHPDDLFDNDGLLKLNARRIIPKEELKLGNSLLRYKKKILNLPDADDYLRKDTTGGYRNVAILENYFSDIIKKNPSSFRVVSPDELASNLLGGIKKKELMNKRNNQQRYNQVTEILNENICQGLMQGYIMTGRHCIMISYEAFMPIVISMVSQFAKWLFQSQQVHWRSEMSSINYLLTSLCWANTYSHQNPEFINSLLSNNFDFIRIYLPPDANSLLLCTESCLKSKGRINTIIATKQTMPQWLEQKHIEKGLKDGIVHWDWLPNGNLDDVDIVFVAAGDHPVCESLAGIDEVIEYYPDLKFRFLTVFELTSLGSPELYNHALSNRKFHDLFLHGIPIIFLFHGFPSAVKMLLFDRVESRNLRVLGYINKSFTSTNSLNKSILNECSRYHVALHAAEILFSSGKLDEEAFKSIKNRLMSKINTCLIEGME